MESQSQKIIMIIEKIIPLLAFSKDPLIKDYQFYLTEILKSLNRPHNILEFAEKIMSFYGGMNTFNDITLRGLSPTQEELERNNKFRLLKEELYQACKEIIIMHRQ